MDNLAIPSTYRVYQLYDSMKHNYVCNKVPVIAVHVYACHWNLLEGVKVTTLLDDGDYEELYATSIKDSSFGER